MDDLRKDFESINITKTEQSSDYYANAEFSSAECSRNLLLKKKKRV